jgi:hypothetical protein
MVAFVIKLEQEPPMTLCIFKYIMRSSFKLLNDAIGNHKHVKSWIQTFTKARNGKGAWIAFKLHYCGSNKVEAIKAEAEKVLETGDYTGEIHATTSKRTFPNIRKPIVTLRKQQANQWQKTPSTQVVSITLLRNNVGSYFNN